MVKYEDMEEGRNYQRHGTIYQKSKGVLYWCDESERFGNWYISEHKMSDIVEMLFEEMPWEPEIGDEYYFPSFEQLDGYILTFWADSRLDKRAKKAVGVYKTREEAQAKARELGWLE